MPKAATPKRYAVTLDPEAVGKGMKLVSLVKSPAIGVGWVALASAAQQPIKRVHLSSAAGAAKQVLTGPLLIPGLDILRLDAENQPFYINFSAEQIEEIAHRFMSEASGLSLSNQNHADALEGNQIRELWLTADAAIDKAAHMGFDVPAGTLMASMKVADADFWANEVETGNVTGFSIEGLFDFSELKLQAASAAAPKPMTFKQKIQAALALFSSSVALAAIELKDGTPLEVDDATGEVFTLDADGKRGTAQPDGDYTLSDDTAFVVKDGKQVGHKPAEAPADKTAEEKLAEETAAADKAKTDKAPDTAAVIKTLQTVVEGGETDTVKLVEAITAAIKALGGTAPAVDTTKLSAQRVKLETVEMLDGSSLSYNPISRLLSDASGQPVPSGYHACKDGSFFRVETNQYTYTIDAETYKNATTVLSEATAEVTRLSAIVPAGQRVKLGAAVVTGSQEVNLAEMSPGKRRLHLAKEAAKS